MPGRDDDKHVGNPMSHLFRRRNGAADDPVGASEVTPVDLAAVQADDALLDTLGRADAVPGAADADLVRVLVAWRREVDTESIGPLVDVDTAVATISAARRPPSRWHSVLGPVAAAAAVLVIAFAAVGLGAKSAQPGDVLFPAAKVLYSKYARSVEAAEMVKIELGNAQEALDKGDTSQARQSLERAQEQLAVIAEAQGHTMLVTEHRKLEEKLDGTPSLAEPDSTTEPPPSASTSAVLVPPPSSSVSTTTATTTSARPSSESQPPPTDVSTPPSPTGSVESEPATAETRSGGGAVPLGGENSSSPPVTAPSG